ncbi:MAG: prepilin peptidase [Pseudobutyrivibrio sp.]|nr:prepilin peptidase [Pseudobutyrivibrio sp.]
MYTLIPLLITFIFGTLIGSFLNVLIYRVPRHEDFVVTKSHCMSCGYTLRWFDLIPIVSWLILGGKCRKCKAKVSMQYPIIEALSGLLWASIVYVTGLNLDALILCLMASALLALSVIDFRTLEIPVGFNIFLTILGVFMIMLHRDMWYLYLVGSIVVALPLAILYYTTHGAAIGGGDVKLMFASGLIIGYRANLIAFFLGCVLGAVIHVIRMRFFKADRTLAMGPYLSAGIIIAALFAEEFIAFYINLF